MTCPIVSLRGRTRRQTPPAVEGLSRIATGRSGFSAANQTQIGKSEYQTVRELGESRTESGRFGTETTPETQGIARKLTAKRAKRTRQ